MKSFRDIYDISIKSYNYCKHVINEEDKFCILYFYLNDSNDYFEISVFSSTNLENFILELIENYKINTNNKLCSIKVNYFRR